jgi:hypothetical protein
MTAFVRNYGRREAIQRQRVQTQQTKAELKKLAGLPSEQLLARREQVAKVLLNHPDECIRREAEQRRHAQLLRGIGGPWRSGT